MLRVTMLRRTPRITTSHAWRNRRSDAGPEAAEPVSEIGWRRVGTAHRAGPRVCGIPPGRERHLGLTGGNSSPPPDSVEPFAMFELRRSDELGRILCHATVRRSRQLSEFPTVTGMASASLDSHHSCGPSGSVCASDRARPRRTMSWWTKPGKKPRRRFGGLKPSRLRASAIWAVV